MLIYLTGVMAGSLTVAVADPSVFLAGASGGVYALITAHLANVIFNWQEMEFPAVRLLGFILIAGVDTGVAVYYRSVRTCWLYVCMCMFHIRLKFDILSSRRLANYLNWNFKQSFILSRVTHKFTIFIKSLLKLV